jgi:mitotic spindle assembly checkpoint protein MAD1
LQITQLKKEIQHQNTIQTELELKFAAKEKASENERNQLKVKVGEYEKIIKKTRKSENKLKEDLVKEKNIYNNQQRALEQRIFNLENEKETSSEEFTFKINELNNRISDITRESAELSTQLTVVEEERDSLKASNVELQQKLDDFKALKSELEREKMNHQNAQIKIKDLEYEVSSYGNWKDVAKASHERMTTMSGYEKEVKRLSNTNRNLHDSIGNKLLMEEQVHTLQTRLERYEKSSVDQISLQTQIQAIEIELKEWKNLGKEFLPKECANNPINVHKFIEQLMHRDLLLMSEKSSISSEKSSFQDHLIELKRQNEAYAKQVENLEKSLKTHQSVIVKLQKKMKLVQSERDAQREMLDSYERDLTFTQSNQPNNSQETQLKLRVDMLTNSLAGFKELCAKLEADLAETRGNPSSLSDPTYCTNEQYRIIKKDMEALRSENEKLQKRKNELEIEIENITLRSNVMYDERIKILHIKNNPASIAQEQAAVDVEKLKAEIERLKIRNRKLEEDRDDLTTRVNETMNLTMNFKDLQKLRDENKSLLARSQENEKILTRVNQEFREVVYILFGYKMDRYGGNKYR